MISILGHLHIHKVVQLQWVKMQNVSFYLLWFIKHKFTFQCWLLSTLHILTLNTDNATWPWHSVDLSLFVLQPSNKKTLIHQGLGRQIASRHMKPHDIQSLRWEKRQGSDFSTAWWKAKDWVFWDIPVAQCKWAQLPTPSPGRPDLSQRRDRLRINHT